MHQALFDVATEDATFALQLCYFRGLMEFEATPWMTKPGPLLDALNAVYCQGGATQIERVLRHAWENSKVVVDKSHRLHWRCLRGECGHP